jgi:RNA polymerase sigma-70 factor (ECF subfamily)
MPGTAEQADRSDDLRLVASLRAGDEGAFADLVDGWSGSMLRLARSYVGTAGAAEEVVQDTWLAVLQGLDGFRGQASLRTWVYRILVNQARRRGARDARTVPFASLARDQAGPTVDPSRFRAAGERYPGGWRELPEEWPEQVTLTKEVQDVVLAALATLPPRQRTVVALRDVDGHTAQEVSVLLDVTPGNQRVLLHRGRAVVRAHLERYLAGHGEDGGGATP